MCGPPHLLYNKRTICVSAWKGDCCCLLNVFVIFLQFLVVRKSRQPHLHLWSADNIWTSSLAPLCTPESTDTQRDKHTPEDHKGQPSHGTSGPPSLSHTLWHRSPWFISLAVWSVKEIITSEGLSPTEDLLLFCLPCRGNGEILLMFTALQVCVCVCGIMLCALVMPEAWPAWLSSPQDCLPSRIVLTSAGFVCKCFCMHALAEVLVCVDMWCVAIGVSMYFCTSINSEASCCRSLYSTLYSVFLSSYFSVFCPHFSYSDIYSHVSVVVWCTDLRPAFTTGVLYTLCCYLLILV